MCNSGIQDRFRTLRHKDRSRAQHDYDDQTIECRVVITVKPDPIRNNNPYPSREIRNIQQITVGTGDG